MTTEMKKALKLMKYGFQLKTNVFSAILITLGGLVLLVGSGATAYIKSSPYMLGAFYLILGPMCMIQVQLSLLYSNLAKSSPRARMLEIRLADFISAIVVLGGYTLISIYTLIRNSITPSTYPPAALLSSAILCGLQMIYFAVAYKFFIFGIILMLFSVGIVFTGLTLMMEVTLKGSFALSMGACCFLGYLVLIVCLVLAGLVRRAVYRFPLSKLAGGAKLRKQL